MPRARLHYHKCSNDGTVWKHSDNCSDSVAAHKCPQCGKPEFWKHDATRREKREAVAGNEPDPNETRDDDEDESELMIFDDGGIMIVFFE